MSADDAVATREISRMKMTLEFAQKAFIFSGGRLLLVRKSDNDPYHPGRWEVPGGRLRVSEDLDLEHHIRREVWEEVGIKIEPGPPFHLWDWVLPSEEDDNQIRIVAVARDCEPISLDATTENQVPGDHLSEATWVSFKELLDYELIPGLRPVIEHFLKIHS
jgi:8-oxo-dGTP pyrophosphatase MutT (NUDIX family)